MSGNDESNDDLVMGRTNHAQDPTRLFANEDGHPWGEDLGDPGGPVLDVRTGDMQRPGGGLRCDTAISAAGASYGVFAVGQRAGVMGQSNDPNGSGTGVVGESSPAGGIGVQGRGNPGVFGEARDPGANGVEGHSDLGAGVVGRSSSGDGVVGVGDRGRGAAFSSSTAAQLHLEPRWLGQVQRLPCDGRAGDLLMASLLSDENERDPDPEGKASLWVCIRSSEGDMAAGDGIPAVWGRVQFDIVFTCQDGMPAPGPDHPHRIEG